MKKVNLISEVPIYAYPKYNEMGCHHAFYEGNGYVIRRLGWGKEDECRQIAYQRLRADIFVGVLKWSIPVIDGCERDRYDTETCSNIHVHCVYGRSGATELLLGGVRIFELNSWEESMIPNEFFQAGMISAAVLEMLHTYYQPDKLLELTRFCILRPSSMLHEPFHLIAARDYVYATMCALAEHTGRTHALAVVDQAYYQVMKRCRFALHKIYSEFERSKRGGHALVDIDIKASMQTILKIDPARAKRMLELCQGTDWIFED